MGRSSSGRRPSGRMGRRTIREAPPVVADVGCTSRRTVWCPHALFWALVDRLKNTRNTEFGKACFKLKVPREVPPRASRDSRSSESTRVPNLNRVIAADARAGTTVGKYKLHEIVGRGGMGVVYRAEHVYIGKEVAVKILHDGYGGREESIKRFLREARAASLINHPNIVDITDFGKSSDGTVFFVMEFLRGRAAGRGPAARAPAGAAARDHHHQPDRGRAGRGPRQGHRPPRSQAREHHAHPARGAPRADPADQRRDRHPHGDRTREGVRLREDPRLRRRQGARPNAPRGASRSRAWCSARPSTWRPRPRASASPTRAPTSTRSA